MVPRVVVFTLFCFALIACDSGSADHQDNELNGVASLITRPVIRPLSVERLGAVAKHISTAIIPRKIGQATVKQNVQRTLLSVILDAEGIPRSQIKNIFEGILDPKSASCAGISCSRVFGIKVSEIDGFLDDLKAQVEKSAHLSKAENMNSKSILLASLERSNNLSEVAKKRSYTVQSKAFDETVYISHKSSQSDLLKISVEREVSWNDGSKIRKESYRGSVTYGLRGDVLEVHTLDSFPEGKGTGSVLMKEVALQAQKLGKQKIHTLSTAHSAHDFYHKIGFRPEKGELSRVAKSNPDLYQSSLDAARATPGFLKKTRPEMEAMIDKALGRHIATWEALTQEVLKNTASIRYN